MLPKVLLVLGLGVCVTVPAQGADVAALVYTQGVPTCYAGGPGPGGGGGGGYTMGWSFTPTQNVTVTALAVADAGGPGFIFTHSMFLWDSARNLLASAVAPAGPNPGGVEGANEYRYYPVAPATLNAGQTYIVASGWPAAASNSDPMDSCYVVECAASITFDPRITWIEGRLDGSLDRFPTTSLGSGNPGLQMLGRCNVLLAPPAPPCPADLNGDHVINTGDLTLLLAQFGHSATPPGSGADINADGAVNTADLTLLLAAFGQNCP